MFGLGSPESPDELEPSALDATNRCDGVDNELDFDIKPKATAVDKRASTTRLFGQGRFRSRNGLRKHFSRGGDRPEQQNLFMAEEPGSSVEVVRRKLSETADFAECMLGESSQNNLKPRPTRNRSSTSDETQRRPLQRSASMQVAPTSQRSMASLANSGLSNGSSFASLVEENSNPNLHEPPDLPRERKKLRARRHSFAVASSPTSRQPSTSSELSHLHQELQWLAPHMETPASSRNDSAEAFAALSQGSIGSISTTPSRRKRGVCGSPLYPECEEGIQFSGSSNSSSRRSRSRIFSLEEPIQPCRSPRGDPMDESSGEESLSSSPDVSMEIVATLQARAPLPDNTQCILDTMPSIEDLQFLVGELKKSTSRSFYGQEDTWKVVPSAKTWPDPRRKLFFTWAIDQLGFTLRSAGPGFSYVQISRIRGSRVLDRLEAALAEWTEKPQTTEDLTVQAFPGFSSPAPTNKRRSDVSAMKSEDTRTSKASDLVAEDLVDRLTSLTLSEAKSAPTKQTLALNPERETSLYDGRSSIGSIAVKNLRNSLDSQHGATDLNLQHFGISPCSGPSGQPTTMSFGSWSSAIKSESTNPEALGMTPCAERLKLPLTSVKFAATPLNKDGKLPWGARPMDGRDWGSSLPCDAGTIVEYQQIFDNACECEDSDEVEYHQEEIEELGSSDFNVNFDRDTFETVFDNDALARKEAERNVKKRLCSLKKRRRQSLFHSASGIRAEAPRHKTSLFPVLSEEESGNADAVPATVLRFDEGVMSRIFSLLDENDLITTASSVCKTWAEFATEAHVNLLLKSVEELENFDSSNSQPILERSWDELHDSYPWASFLAKGGAKRVYRVCNSSTRQQEALSVMDVSEIESIQIVANELAVAAMLSSFVRRGLCPNFIQMNSVFTCAYPPPESAWGDEEDKHPRGKCYNPQKKYRKPRIPKIGHAGRYQYISMELASEGDAEEFIKRQPNEELQFNLARSLLFQIAFSLFAASDRFSVKHYDVKLLNIFVNNLNTSNSHGVVLRYGLGSHVFALRMDQESAFVAKLADFGTSNYDPALSGQPVTIAHFTTLENSPPDFFILGDDAQQGHEHDSFGLGLCMLHLFTGNTPYEEIMEDVICPPSLKKRLKLIWEDEDQEGFSVMRSIIFDGVDLDEDGTLVGDVDETFYDTLYRFLVLFGVPQTKFNQKTHPRVWKAIADSLVVRTGTKTNDKRQYSQDCNKYSILTGNNKYIARARNALTSVDGGLDILMDLCSFDPAKRATPMQVLNSKFMEDLREGGTETYGDADVFSYMSFATGS